VEYRPVVPKLETLMAIMNYSHAADGSLLRDIITLEGDSQPGMPLLQPCMRAGRRLAAPETLKQARQSAAAGWPASFHLESLLCGWPSP
jgi:hypothetical protein